MTGADVSIENMKKAKAKLSRGPRNYLKQYGVYLFEIEMTKSVNGNNGLTYITDLKVIESAKLVHPKVDPAIEPHAVGETVTYQENNCSAGIAGEIATNRFKGYLSSATGIPDGDKLNDKLARFFGTDEAGKIQGATYLLVKCVIFPKELPPNPAKKLLGKTIPVEKWANVAMTDEQVAAAEARRKNVGLPSFAEALG